MKTLLATVASAGLALSLATGAALAQAAAGAAVNPLTANDVLPNDPFAGVDIAAAGNTAATIKMWGDTLTVDQRTEIYNRCDVISLNQANYQADAATFCTAFLEAYPGLVPGQDMPAAPAPN